MGVRTIIACAALSLAIFEWTATYIGHCLVRVKPAEGRRNSGNHSDFSQVLQAIVLKRLE